MKHIMQMSIQERVKLLKKSCSKMIQDLISYIEKNTGKEAVRFLDIKKSIGKKIVFTNESFLQNHVFGKCVEIRNRYNLLKDSETYLDLMKSYPDMKFFYMGRRFKNFHQFPGSIVGFTEKVKKIVNQISLPGDDDGCYYASPFISFGYEDVHVHACYPLTFKIMPAQAEMIHIKDEDISKTWEKEFADFGFPSHIIDQTKIRIAECRQSVAGGLEALAPLIAAAFGPLVV